METRRCLFLALSFTMVLAAAASTPVHALPPPCEEVCDSSTSCDTACSAFNYTCGDWGVCDPGGSSSECTAVYGTSGGDTLNGYSTDDCIYGYGGADTLYGQAGNDQLYGGDDNDTLKGGSGDDFLDGGAGTDQCDGETGNDSCTAGETYISCP